MYWDNYLIDIVFNTYPILLALVSRYSKYFETTCVDVW